ncbi:MAG: dephospho-CoA kinase [Tepidisphaerales bacterium]
MSPASPTHAPAVPVIGLVGGIASGKSTYARLLARRGCPVFSADEAVAELYRRHDILQTLATWWPSPPYPPVRKPDGSLDRQAVARIVFADPAQRQRLEQLLHPLVADARQRHLAACRGDEPAVVWDIPLLLETGLGPRCTVVAFVDAPESVRLARVVARGWSPQDLSAREAAQWPLERKRDAADVVLDGTADPVVADRAVTDLLALARQKFAAAPDTA